MIGYIGPCRTALNMGILPRCADMPTIAGGPHIGIAGERPVPSDRSVDRYLAVDPAKPLAAILPFIRPRDEDVAESKPPAPTAGKEQLLLPQISRTLFASYADYEMPADKARRLRREWSVEELIHHRTGWVENMADLESDDRLMGVGERVAFIIDDIIIMSGAGALARGMDMLRLSTEHSANAFRFLAEFVRRGCDEAKRAMGRIGEEEMYLFMAQYAHLYGIVYAMGKLYDIETARAAALRMDREDDELGMADYDRLLRAYRQYRACEIYRPLEESERTPGAQIIRLSRFRDT